MVHALQIERIAAEEQPAFGRPVHASEDLDQGRFAGAVFAEKDMNFATV